MKQQLVLVIWVVNNERLLLLLLFFPFTHYETRLRLANGLWWLTSINGEVHIVPNVLQVDLLGSWFAEFPRCQAANLGRSGLIDYHSLHSHNVAEMDDRGKVKAALKCFKCNRMGYISFECQKRVVNVVEESSWNEDKGQRGHLVKKLMTQFWCN